MGWDPERVDRALQPEPSAIPGEVYALQFRGYADEADGIAAICKAYVETDLLQPQDISILLSRRGLAKRIVEGLEKEGVKLPVTVLVPIWPLDEREGRLTYCVLRLLVDRYDALAVRTWLGLQRGIGLGTIEGIGEFCMSRRFTIWDGLLAISADPTQVPRGRSVKARFDELNTMLEELRSVETVEGVLDYLVGPAEGNLSSDRAQVRRFLDHVIEEEQVEDLNHLVLALQTFDIEAEVIVPFSSSKAPTLIIKCMNSVCKSSIIEYELPEWR